MAIATPEQVHRYPRRFRIIFESLCAALVLIAMIYWGRAILQLAWDLWGRSLPKSLRVAPLIKAIQWLDNSGQRPEMRHFTDLLPAWLWLAGALLTTLYIRNFFPTVRTSGRGMLVEWSNSWAPVAWENVIGVRVTEDLAGERFVLLLQTDRKSLSGWHRFYSFLYRLSFRRGVIITSSISEFMPLIQTILRELEQVARQTGRAPVGLDERAASPFFQLLLSPAGFFSRRSKADKEYELQATEAARSARPGMVTTLMATYPRRIRSLLTGLAAVFAIWGILRTISILRRWIGSAFPATRDLAIFQLDPLPAYVSTWWVPIAAVLVLVLLLPLLIVIRNILPNVESRPQGLAVRFFNRWLLVPWGEITAVKSTELSEDNNVVLIQTTNRPLTIWHRASSLLFDGSHDRGVLLTSALSTFEPLMQQIVLEVSRGQRNVEREEGILNEDAPAWLLRLLFKPSEAISRLVAATRRDPETASLKYSRLIQSATPMIWLAALPTLMLLVDLLINSGLVPSLQRIISAVIFFVFCFLEWPLAAGLAQLLEGNLEDDAHRSRPFYLYPTVQLPRLLVMAGALVLLLLGVPLLPSLLWLAAAGWSFLLTAGLWDELYGWGSTKLLGMGAVPAVYQLLTFLAWISLT